MIKNRKNVCDIPEQNLLIQQSRKVNSGDFFYNIEYRYIDYYKNYFKKRKKSLFK